MEITETYYALNRTAWREWLKKNHRNVKELWLLFYKKHTGKPCISYNNAVEEALCFGWIHCAKKDETRQKRLKECIMLLSQGKKLPMK